MGKRGGRKGGSRSSGPRNDDERSEALGLDQMKNERFESYYRKQALFSESEGAEEEWGQFFSALRTVLPTSFRVAGCRETAQVINDLIKNTYIPALGDVKGMDGEVVEPPVQIPWYPGGLAWQFHVSKRILRKDPEFKRFHNFLVYETEIGNISRSETVSMIPPVFLDVQPHHRVLDMCAAPGSKTAQLLEAIHSTPPSSDGTATELSNSTAALSIPSGLLVANDSDHKRTHLLIHQSARLPSPCLLVTNLDASIYPGIKIAKEGGGTEALTFDRILCDVPCSGDGTMRKNIGIWKHWTTGDGNGLHSLQLRILQRAMKMLKPGGRIVYSTCSLNPVENEAVIAAALRSIPGFVLVESAPLHPSLRRRPGLSKWTPAVTVNRAMTFFDTHEEYLESLGDKEKAKREAKQGKKGVLGASLWPPADPGPEDWSLDRCIRIYPHLQDTGGFFVAVLETAAEEGSGKSRREAKKRTAEEAVDANGEVPESKKLKLEDAGGQEAGEDEESGDAHEQPSLESAEKNGEGNALPKSKTEQQKLEETGGSFKENPYTFLPPDDPNVVSCIENIHLTSSFPSSNLFVRNPSGETAKSIYLATPLVRSILESNDYKRLRIVTAGTKIFAKQEGMKKWGVKTQFRVLSEGLPVVLPYIKPETVLDADLSVLREMLENFHPMVDALESDFSRKLEPQPTGHHVVRFRAREGEGGTLSHDLLLPIWKSQKSVSLMIDKKAKSALSLRVFGEDLVSGKASDKITKEPIIAGITPVAEAEPETETVPAHEDKISGSREGTTD